jgi:calcineurin-like phosphoesterase family protein
MKKNFTDTDTSKLYVSGCLHLNHNPKWDNPLWKMRGYNSADEMTDDIINTINIVCNKSDKLLVLGDFCLNTNLIQFNEFIKRIEPEIWMVRGNHNSPWENAYKEWSLREHGHYANHVKWGEVTYLGNYVQLKWNKRSFVCNHYPFAIWDGSHKGVMSLHSHNHGSYAPSLPDSADTGKQLDCGWDVHKKPLSFEELMEIMDKKQISISDHHTSDVNGGF